MGADHLGDDAPDDTMLALATVSTDPNTLASYGWPYCYFKNGKVFDDPTFTSSLKKIDCVKVPAPVATFAAHSAPLGLEYFGRDSKDPVLQNYFLVALHGSSKKRLNRGYRVVRLKDQSPPEDFITGFIKKGVIFGRPCGILKIGSDAFLLTDDHSGVIYYIRSKT
jgi:glucose/arabinose dehydrogenase